MEHSIEVAGDLKKETILLHGFGADASDLVPLSQILQSHFPSQYKSFSCTEPPLDGYIKRFATNHEKMRICQE